MGRVLTVICLQSNDKTLYRPSHVTRSNWQPWKMNQSRDVTGASPALSQIFPGSLSPTNWMHFPEFLHIFSAYVWLHFSYFISSYYAPLSPTCTACPTSTLNMLYFLKLSLSLSSQLHYLSADILSRHFPPNSPSVSFHECGYLSLHYLPAEFVERGGGGDSEGYICEKRT